MYGFPMRKYAITEISQPGFRRFQTASYRAISTPDRAEPLHHAGSRIDEPHRTPLSAAGRTRLDPDSTISKPRCKTIGCACRISASFEVRSLCAVAATFV